MKKLLFIILMISTYTFPIFSQTVNEKSISAYPDTIYANFSFQIQTKYFDDNYTNLDTLYLNLINSGNNILLQITEGTTSGTSIISQGAEFLATQPTYSYTNNDTSLIVNWTIKPNWSWSSSSDIEIGVACGNDSGNFSGWYISNNLHIVYNNSLEIKGNLHANAEFQGEITSGSWTRSSEKIHWYGTWVTFANSDKIPLTTDFSFQLQDDNGNSWTTQDNDTLDLQTTTSATTDTSVIYTLQLVSIPNGGSCINIKNFTIKVDGTAPNTTDDSDNLWHNENITIHLISTDYESGVAYTEYKLNNGILTVGDSVIIYEEGENTLQYLSVDKVGNIEPLTNATNTIKIDKTSPYFDNTNTNPNEIGDIYDGNITIYTSFHDDLSGPDEAPSVRFKIGSNGTFSNYYTMTWNTTKWSYTIQGAENQFMNIDTLYWQFKGKDDAGNIAESEIYRKKITKQSIQPIILDNFDMPNRIYPDKNFTISTQYQDGNGATNLHNLTLFIIVENDTLHLQAKEGVENGTYTILNGNNLLSDNNIQTYSYTVLGDTIKCNFNIAFNWQLDDGNVIVVGAQCNDDNGLVSDIKYSSNIMVYRNKLKFADVVFDSVDSVDINGNYVENGDWIGGNAHLEISGKIFFDGGTEFPITDGIKVKLYTNTIYSSFASPISSTDGSFLITGFQLPNATSTSYQLKLQLDGIPDNVSYIDISSLTERTIKIDADNPMTSDDIPLGWQTTPFYIHFNPFDYSSGIKYTKYSFDGGTTFSIGDSVLIDEDGIYQLKYYAVDNVANYDVMHNGSKQAMLDKTAPIFYNWNITPDEMDENYTDNISVQVSISDNLSGFSEMQRAQMRYKRGNFDSHYCDFFNMNLAKGNWVGFIPKPNDGWNVLRGDTVYYEIQMTDVAGNIGSSGIRKIYVAKINNPPVILSISPHTGQYKDPIYISTTYSDPDGDSIDKTYYQYRLISDKKTTDWFTIDTDYFPNEPYEWISNLSLYKVQLRARACDSEGMWGDYTVGDTFLVDNQPPITTDDTPSEWQGAPFTIHLNRTDGNGVGFANNGKTYYSIDGSFPTIEGTEITIANEGEFTIKYYSVDSLGNAEDVKTAENLAKLDMSPPTFVKFNNPDLNEDTPNDIFIIVKIIDAGCGLSDSNPLYSYKRSDLDANFTPYDTMTLVNADSSLFGFTIPKPENGWQVLWEDTVFYKVKATDKLNHSSESSIQYIIVKDVNHSPEITSISPTTGAYNNPIELSIQYNDADNDTLNTVEYYYKYVSKTTKDTWYYIDADNSPSTPFSWESDVPLGHIKIKARGYDGGLWSNFYESNEILFIDNMPPETIDDVPSTWQTSDFVITLSRDDGNGVGFTPNGHTYYSIDGSDPSIEGTQILINTEGIYTVKYYSIDNLGNVEPIRTAINTAKLDRTGPYFYNWIFSQDTLLENDDNNLIIKVQVADSLAGTGSHIPKFKYKRGGYDNEFTNYAYMFNADGYWRSIIPAPPNGWQEIAGDSVAFQVSCTDILDNYSESEVKYINVLHINHAPICNLLEPNIGWFNDPLPLKLSGTDIDGDTLTQFQYEYKNVDSTEWETIVITNDTLPYSWNSNIDLGKIILRGKVFDGELWSDYIYSDTINIDNQPPTTTDDIDNNWHGITFSIHLSINDGNGAGCNGGSSATYYAIDDSLDMTDGTEILINTEGIHKIYYYSIDSLGNQENIKLATNRAKLDLSAPQIDTVYAQPDSIDEDYENNIEIFSICSDSLSGIDSVFFRYKRENIDENFSEWLPMTKYNTLWSSEIPIPSGGWHNVVDKKIVYQIRAYDLVGNNIIGQLHNINVGNVAHPPEYFHLLSPTNGDTVGETFTFRWNKAVDIDNDEIIYYLFYSSNFDFSDSIAVSDTFYTVTTPLENHTYYYWKVRAYDNATDYTESIELWMFYTNFTGINDNIPTSFSLKQNYPNPFNPKTEIMYSIAKKSPVKIVIYNIYGQIVKIFNEGIKSPGHYTIVWNASKFANGIYFYKIVAENYIETKKMLLLK